VGRKSVERYRYKDKAVRQKHVVRFMVYFQNNGFENISMSQMAADIGMSKTTIYNHFKTKEELVEAAVTYKLSIIEEYETVLTNLTLSYTERYRKAMIFFCVQTFDVSNKLLLQIEGNYPNIHKKIKTFEKRLFLNLKSYYEIGKEIGVFKDYCNPVLLSLDDQKFFDLLADSQFLADNEIEILQAFAHHFTTKFGGIANVTEKETTA